MEREKQELQDFIEKDNKAMKDKLSKEEAERERKEKEMAVWLFKKLFFVFFVKLISRKKWNFHQKIWIEFKIISIGISTGILFKFQPVFQWISIDI